jgi:hypothetical protein
MDKGKVTIAGENKQALQPYHRYGSQDRYSLRKGSQKQSGFGRYQIQHSILRPQNRRENAV